MKELYAGNAVQTGGSHIAFGNDGLLYITVGGAELGGQAIAAGMVDELQLLLGPILVGGGKAALPGDVRVRLELLDEHRFAGGMVFLRYAVTG